MSRITTRLFSAMSASTPISSPFTSAVVNSMKKLYPESLADKSWDNTGLLLEAPFNHTRRQRNSVLLTIDLTKAVADEAIARKDSVVIAYHPIIFRGLKSLTFKDTQQQSLLRLASEGISVYSPHTAVDATPGGMGDWLCDLVTSKYIASGSNETQTCSSSLFSAPQYPKPSIVKASDSALLPHERSTIHPSAAPPADFEDAGMGRLVTFEEPQPLTTIVDNISKGLGYPGGVPIAIPQSSSVDEIKIRTVGVCPGSGSGVLMKGVSQVPDLLFTGEISHHETLAAIENGSVVIALAHSNTERGYLSAVMKEKLEKTLTEEWKTLRAEGDNGTDGSLKEIYADTTAEVHVSEKDRDPFGIMVRKP
ncbi:NGG1p interacting factor 3 [Aspergillus karnatakaensis]|uniref:Nif3-like dinuclear metal center hexameric protein n=1 Tax=Aspergillus karnatakaensis TaxID=1810916 RepID=UPI003CCDB75B